MNHNDPDLNPAAEEAIARHADMVYRIALSQTGQKQHAEDVFQEVFLKFLQKGPDTEPHIRHWLVRVTVNCCHSLFSSSWFRKTTPLEETLAFPSPEENEVYFAVQALSPAYRLVIHLYYYEGFSIREIASILKLSEGAIKSRLSRGRAILRTALKGEYDGL